MGDQGELHGEAVFCLTPFRCVTIIVLSVLVKCTIITFKNTKSLSLSLLEIQPILFWELKIDDLIKGIIRLPFCLTWLKVNQAP